MHLVEVDVVGVQAFEAALAGGADVVWRQVLAADFGGDDGFFAASPQGAPQHRLREAVAVALGRVDEVDAGVQRGAHRVYGVALFLMPPVVAADNAPKAKADGGDHQGGIAELSFLHGMRLSYSPEALNCSHFSARQVVPVLATEHTEVYEYSEEIGAGEAMPRPYSTPNLCVSVSLW